MLLAMLLTLLPFVIEKGWQVSRQVESELSTTTRDTERSVDLARSQFLQLRSGIENTLAGFALLAPMLPYVTPSVCGATVRKLKNAQQKLGSVSILTPQGTTYCSSEDGQEGRSRSPETHIQASILQQRAAWTDLGVAPDTGYPVLRSALAFRAEGEIAFLVEIGVDGQMLAASLFNAFENPAAALYLVAQNGDVLFMQAPRQTKQSQPLLQAGLIRHILSRSEGTVEANTYDAGNNIVGFTLLPGTSVRLVSVLPIEGLFADANRQMIVGLVTLLVEAAIITFIMMALIEYMLLGALRSLVRVAEKITAGDVCVRAVVKTPFPDLHLLAKAFNVMVDRLERAALIDGLTKLPNRRHLDQQCDLSMKRYQRYGLPFSVAMIDVDKFKLYNDNYGHSAGDQVLSQISEVLSDFVRRSDDTAGRYGGEEFLLVLAEADRTKIAFHLDRLRTAVERLAISHRGTEIGSVTVSIGFAIVREDDTVASLIDRADQSLYAVKANGRNGVLCLEEPDDQGQIDPNGLLAESA